MAFNCCYRLESQKKSRLAAFLENNLLYLLTHVHLYVNVHPTALGRKQTFLHGVMQLLFPISITHSGLLAA